MGGGSEDGGRFYGDLKEISFANAIPTPSFYTRFRFSVGM